MIRSRVFTSCLLAALLVLLTACAGPSLKKERSDSVLSYSRPPATQGVLHELSQAIVERHGQQHSGFSLLDSSHDGLNARLALIDSAVDSIDIQTYLWYPDNSGRLILERAVEAANRGVHVRLIVDDLLTIGLDQTIFELHQRPNIEFRLFNPWKDRSVMARAGEMVAEMERLNQRMHDKLVVADGHAAIVGGRNIGDHYFGLSHDYNFHDLDMLGFGAIAQQAAGMFDHFWNSDLVVSADNLDVEPDPEFGSQTWEELKAKNRAAPDLQAIGVDRKDWTAYLREAAKELHPGTSLLVYDDTEGEEVRQIVITQMFPFMNEAQEELLITNAYIIPGQPAIDFIQSLTDRGVTVRILTNSLESHDVPAVNSHYRGWRDDFILAGAQLYELRADAEIASIVNLPPVEGEFVGLHTMAFVVDRRKVFIGSMNFDPRSANINTEAGAFVDSPGLATDLARAMLRDMSPENAWQVFLDDNGKPYWVNSDRRVDKQPARDGNQRVMDKIFKVIPKEQY